MKDSKVKKSARYFALCVFFCAIFVFALQAQTQVDSAAVRQVDSLLQVSSALTDQRNFDQAIDISAVAEKLALEKFGRESAAYARCCTNHGVICREKREYNESEKWFLEALSIREKIDGKLHPEYFKTTAHLTNLYYYMRYYEKAEELYLEAATILEKTTGKNHPDYASNRFGLGLTYYEMGDYERAEPLFLQAKAAMEKLGENEDATSDYSTCLNDLATLYSDLGNDEKAESLYREAIANIEKTGGKENEEYPASLNNLGTVYLDRGKYAKAEALFLEAKAIFEKTEGKESPNYVISLFNLATCYLQTGDYAKAEPLHIEAKAGLERLVGNQHPYYATGLHDLATVYYGMGDYKKAESLYREAVTIREKSLGKAHPDYASILNSLANVYVATGENKKAESLYVECALANQALLAKAARHLSELELGRYMDQFSESQDQTLSFARLSDSPKIIATCFDNTVFSKGFLRQSAGLLRQMAQSNLATANNFQRLKTYQRRLAAQYTQPIAERDSALVAQLESQANDLEKELARTVAGWGQAIQQVKWQEVQAALRPGEAAIEFVSYRFYQNKQTDTTFYAALVLLPGTDAPQFIPLFEEREIANLFKSKGARKSEYVNTLYRSAAQTTGGQKSLYQAIWQPLETTLTDVKTVYFSPDGLLHRINFDAITDQQGKSLSARYNLVQLGSTRQLVVPQALASGPNTSAQLYGGIQYDATPRVAVTTAPDANDLVVRGGSAPLSTSLDWGGEPDSTLRGDSWVYLPSTEAEINNAANIMKANGITSTLLKGADATEESFKKIGTNGLSPRVLHVATHGFFFPDPASSPTGGGREGADEKVFKVSENPMIRSGLVLAGGNHAWKTGNSLRPDLEDGILTAYEISQMNLSNTELVVLSACETGLGDLVGNEGVYGLQRAFKIAGARYLIMSLWQVPDVQTQELMTLFYENWLAKKMAIPDALRAAQQAMQAKYEHPFFWAGFVLVE
jgi:CHAT domain-containing protein/Tfp pilus assembly protein PilF